MKRSAGERRSQSDSLRSQHVPLARGAPHGLREAPPRERVARSSRSIIAVDGTTENVRVPSA